MATTASIIVNFGDSEGDVFLAAELDNEKNNGLSSFPVNVSDVHFRVYADCAYTITVTDGATSNGTEDVTETITDEVVSFVGSKTASLSKKVSTVGSVTWMPTGSSDTISTTSGSEVLLETSTAIDDVLAIGKVTYDTIYNEHTLQPPSGMPEDYAIIILVSVSA